MSLFVKICGITRGQDAELAVGLGASALGFVFWPDSPRYVEPATARAIAASLPPSVATVGVFVDEPVDSIARVMDEAGLDIAQLHGRETVAFCREVRIRLETGRSEVSGKEWRERPRSPLGTRVIKAIGPAHDRMVNVAGFDPDVVLLVDAHDPVRLGGTGRTANWEAARDVAAVRRTILAGGLSAANVRQAIRMVCPFGIDVSSGVESSPGIKDSTRLRTFFEALHD